MSKPANYNVKRWFDFAQVVCLFWGPLLKDICSQIYVAFALFNSKGHFGSGQLGVSASTLCNSDGQGNEITSTTDEEDAAKSRNGPNQFHIFLWKGRVSPSAKLVAKLPASDLQLTTQREGTNFF